MSKCYFILPDGNCIARVPKAASHSIAAAVVRRYYPELIAEVNRALPEEERLKDDNLWLSIVPQAEQPRGKIFALIRDPFDRFVSACGMLGLTVRQGLASQDMHFTPQTFFAEGAEAYSFWERDLFCEATGLNYPLPELARGKKKYVVTLDELAELKERYVDDYALLEKKRLQVI